MFFFTKWAKIDKCPDTQVFQFAMSEKKRNDWLFCHQENKREGIRSQHSGNPK